MTEEHVREGIWRYLTERADEGDTGIGVTLAPLAEQGPLPLGPMQMRTNSGTRH